MGNVRRIPGKVADTHKTLVSVGVTCVAGGQEGWIGADGGYLMPRNGAIAQGLRTEFERLVRIHGKQQLLPL